MELHVGLDLGQSQDYTALVLVEQAEIARVKYLRRWPLGTPYPEIVNDVHAIMEALPPGPRKVLAIDQTGVGAPVVDLFRMQSGRAYRIRAVHITGGALVSHDGGISYVPKRNLVAAVSIALQTKKLKVNPGLMYAATLFDELGKFQIKISASGHDSYGAGDDWRVNNHDDLVLALAIALWSGSRPLTEFRIVA